MGKDFPTKHWVFPHLLFWHNCLNLVVFSWDFFIAHKHWHATAIVCKNIMQSILKTNGRHDPLYLLKFPSPSISCLHHATLKKTMVLDGTVDLAFQDWLWCYSCLIGSCNIVHDHMTLVSWLGHTMQCLQQLATLWCMVIPRSNWQASY